MANCVSMMTKNAAFVSFCHPLPRKASLKNVTMCARNSRKSCLDQRPSFLAVVRHISVLNESLPRFPLFHCQRLCEFVSCRDGVCREGILFVQLDVFIVLLCQVCGESRDIVISASPWNVLSGCRMNNLHEAIVVFRGWVDVTYACV